MTDTDRTCLNCCIFIHVYRTRLAFHAGVSVNEEAQCKTIHLLHQPVSTFNCIAQQMQFNNTSNAKQSKSKCKNRKTVNAKHLRSRPVPTFFISPPPPLLPTSFSIQWVHSGPKPATSLVLEVKGVTSSATLLARYLPLNFEFQEKKEDKKAPFLNIYFVICHQLEYTNSFISQS